MDQKNEQKAPLRIKNLDELKRCIRPGTELVATSHSKHPALVGLVRVVTEVQTNAYYSVVKDQPTHQYSTCNYGKGFRSDFEKASNYLFEGTTIKVLDRRSSDGNLAALFLLTAYEDIWRRMIWKFDARGFDFQSVQLSGIQPELYSVYQAVKAISTGNRNIILADLASPELVTDEAFHLIVCALLLAKYGDAILNFEGK